MTNGKLAKIKEQLQKIAIDIETPNEIAAPEQSPEAVMELVDDAIQILEVAEETIPAENPEAVQANGNENGNENGIIGAKTRKAQDDDDDEDDKKKDAKTRRAAEHPDDEDEDKKKDAKVRKGQDEDDDEDEDKEQLEARLKTVEAELDATKRAKLAEDWIEIYPENQRQAKYDTIVNSKDSLKTLERDFKVAKETYDVTRNPKAYQPAKNEGGYLFKKAKLNQVQLEPWKV